jgi:hypothetical protein
VADSVPAPGALRKLSGEAVWLLLAATLGLAGGGWALRRRGRAKR